jgi:hypothetical protein
MGVESLTFEFLKKQLWFGSLALVSLVLVNFLSESTIGPFSKELENDKSLFTLYISFASLIRRDVGIYTFLFLMLGDLD